MKADEGAECRIVAAAYGEDKKDFVGDFLFWAFANNLALVVEITLPTWEK
jgi:hypothetical protein